jgi:vancomycin resistance protein YoaR
VFRDWLRAPRNAEFRVAGARVGILPSAPGRELDVNAISRSLLERPRSTVHRARFRSVAPTLTTQKARALGIEERISEFTTYYPCCAPRVTNIQRAAQILDGTVVAPGGTFSLNEALGKRTEERGFLLAPQIRAGRLEDAVGGGVSQVATTLYNAAFFAGLRLDAHQPHQFYISRYPMGREATVSWGGPELIFTNDWKAGLLVKVSAWSTGISVRFYSSTLGRRVETVTEDPHSYVEPVTRLVKNPALEPGQRRVVQAEGPAGFTVEYTRKVYRGDELIKDERYRTRYDAENAFVEIGPKKKPKPKPKPGAKPQTPASPAGSDAPGTGSDAGTGSTVPADDTGATTRTTGGG